MGKGTEEKNFDTIVFEALQSARVAFYDYISKELYDPATCDLRFTAWVKDVSFKERLRRVEIEEECK